MRERNWLLAAGSLPGKNENQQKGIVLGHAYSILDVAVIDGNKLIQMRNPWGHKEWTGAWSDNSKEWNQKRKQIIYDRMAQRRVTKVEVGADDGVFWISLSDFFTNFLVLYVGQYLDKQIYNELLVESEWSVKNKTAGGCMNHSSFVDNPQFKLNVQAHDQNVPIDITIAITPFNKKGDADFYGFRGFDIQGRRAT